MDEEVEGIAFRDLLTLTIAGFLFIIVLLLPHIHAAKQTGEATKTGDVLIEVFWPEGWATDVDLWVQAPGDRPVGYSAKSGEVFNLLRDDLGMRGDPTPRNYEIAVARGTPPGEYTINVQLYKNDEARYPVPVNVVASAGRSELGLVEIARADVELFTEGEELTVFRFALDAKGRLVAGSLNTLHKSLRSAWLSQ